jgi:hypothetical protein
MNILSGYATGQVAVWSIQLRCKEAELRRALLNAADTAQFTDGSEAAPSYKISHLADGSRGGTTDPPSVDDLVVSRLADGPPGAKTF